MSILGIVEIYETDFGQVMLTNDQGAVLRSGVPTAEKELKAALKRRAERDYLAEDPTSGPPKDFREARELVPDDFEFAADWDTWVNLLLPEALAKAPSAAAYAAAELLRRETNAAERRLEDLEIKAKLDVIVPLLRARGIEIEIDEAGCCPAPCLSIKIDGVLVLDSADHCYLKMFQDDGE